MGSPLGFGGGEFEALKNRAGLLGVDARGFELGEDFEGAHNFFRRGCWLAMALRYRIRTTP